jgi:hypothetical protein
MSMWFPPFVSPKRLGCSLHSLRLNESLAVVATSERPLRHMRSIYTIKSQYDSRMCFRVKLLQFYR